MGRVSHRKLDTWTEERLYDVFWEHLAHLTSPALTKEFLINLLSPTEQVMLAKRLAIAVLLSRKLTYEAIDQTLKVSKSTVMTIHKQLLTGAPGYTRAVKHISNQKKHEAFWDKIAELSNRLSLPVAYGSNKFHQKSATGKFLFKRRSQRRAI